MYGALRSHSCLFALTWSDTFSFYNVRKVYTYIIQVIHCTWRKEGSYSILQIAMIALRKTLCYVFVICYLEHSFRRIVHLLLAFMNSIQAIYNFQSLGRKVRTEKNSFMLSQRRILLCFRLTFQLSTLTFRRPLHLMITKVTENPCSDHSALFKV